MKNNVSSAALCVGAFVQMVGVGLIVSLLPGRVIHLSDSMDHIGFLASFFAVPFVVLQIPVGRLADRYGCKLFLVGGYLLAGITGLLYFNARSILEIMAGRAMQGIAEIPAWALAPALLSLLFSNSRGEVIGRYNASIHIGLMTGSLAPVFIPAFRTGNGVFLLYSAAGFLSAAIILLFVRNPMLTPSDAADTYEGFRGVLSAIQRIRRPELYSGICLYGGGYGAFLTVIPGLLLGEKNLGQVGVTLFFALFYVAISISQNIAGQISDIKGRDVTMIAGLLPAAGGIATFMLFDGATLLLCLFVAACGLGVFCVAALALLGDIAPVSMKGTVSAIFYVFWGTGFFLVPPLLTWMGKSFGFLTSTLLFSFFFFAEIAILSRRAKLREKGKKVRSSSPEA